MKNKKVYLFFALGVLLIIVLNFLFVGYSNSSVNSDNKLKVVASFYPTYDFAKNIGGDRVDVRTLIPVGVEPHEYEPTPQDIKDLSSAQVFILNGIIEDSWAPKLMEGIDNKNLIVIDTSKGIRLLNSMDADMPGNDPHIWLDPVLAKIQVMAIRDAFIKADPAGKDYYDNNTNLFLQKLDVLDAEFRAVFPTCQKKDIIITHATLAYFCKEYGCNQVPVEGVNAEGDPSPAVLAEVIKQAKEKNITTVFVENLMNPKSAETLADELHGQVAVFNSVHGLTTEEQQRGENYISQMQENVGIIKTSLNCRG